MNKLTAEQYLAELSDVGYTVIRDGLAQAEVQALLTSFRQLSITRQQTRDLDQPFLNRGHDVLYNIQREDVRYLRTFTGNPLVMEILRGLLNDPWYRQIPQDQSNFILRALGGRSSGPGALPLHIDSFVPSSGKLCFACQVAVILEDQTAERGCTVLVPGSHRSDSYASQEALADAIPLETRAGDIVIWDSRLWHGALGNTSGNSRWSMIATFVRWWIKQNFDVTGTLPESIYQALTDDEKGILGYCSLPPRDEYERTDIKSGHADLKPTVAEYRA